MVKVKAKIQDISEFGYDLYVIRTDQDGNVPLSVFKRFPEACQCLVEALEIQTLDDKETLLYEAENGSMLLFCIHQEEIKRNDYWPLGHYVKEVILNYEIDSCCFVNFMDKDFWSYEKVDTFCLALEQMLSGVDLVKDVSIYE